MAIVPSKATPTEGGKHFIIELKVGHRNSQAATQTLPQWRCVALCWLRFGDDEQFGAGMKKQPIVDQDK